MLPTPSKFNLCKGIAVVILRIKAQKHRTTNPKQSRERGQTNPKVTEKRPQILSGKGIKIKILTFKERISPSKTARTQAAKQLATRSNQIARQATIQWRVKIWVKYPKNRVTNPKWKVDFLSASNHCLTRCLLPQPQEEGVEVARSAAGTSKRITPKTSLKIPTPIPVTHSSNKSRIKSSPQASHITITWTFPRNRRSNGSNHKGAENLRKVSSQVVDRVTRIMLTRPSLISHSNPMTKPRHPK